MAAWLAELAGQGVGHDLPQAVAAAPVSSRVRGRDAGDRGPRPRRPGAPFGALAEWTELDDTVLGELWGSYQGPGRPVRPRAPRRPPHRGGGREILDAAQKKQDGASRVRCSEAVALGLYYGRPACGLTDTEVLILGLPSPASSTYHGAAPLNAKGWVGNANHDPTLTDPWPSDGSAPR